MTIENSTNIHHLLIQMGRCLILIPTTICVVAAWTICIVAAWTVCVVAAWTVCVVAAWTIFIADGWVNFVVLLYAIGSVAILSYVML
jgi:hypothetical protein